MSRLDLDIFEKRHPRKKGGNKNPDGSVVREKRPRRRRTGVSLSVGDRTLAALLRAASLGSAAAE